MRIKFGIDKLSSARSLPLIILVVCSFVLSLIRPAMGADLMVNGSFETGNFTGWTVTNATNPYLAWSVSGAGAGGGFVPLPVATLPQHGTRVAWHGVASNAGSPFILYQQVAIPAGTANLRWRDRFQDDLATFCGSTGEPVCGTVTYRVDVVNTSNVVLQNLLSITAPANGFTDTGWQLRIASLNAFAGQTVRIRFMTTATVTFDGPGQLELDAVSLQSPALATAAGTTVSGRALTSYGRAISRSVVTLTGADGNIRTALTSTFGNYQFDDVPVGETYIISIADKRYMFNEPTRVLTVTDTLANVDFTSLF